MEHVEQIKEDQMYTATITFRSLGSNAQVLPETTFSHAFPDDYEGDWPAAFLCVRDINIMLTRYMQHVANTAIEDEWLEDENVDEVEKAQAILDYAAAAERKGTVH